LVSLQSLDRQYWDAIFQERDSPLIQLLDFYICCNMFWQVQKVEIRWGLLFQQLVETVRDMSPHGIFEISIHKEDCLSRLYIIRCLCNILK
jgi:hypothetical protein